jgi:hypothetical protein
MSGLTSEEIAQFLEAIGAALHAALQLPEFNDLTERDPDAEGEGVIYASPDDIEAALIMGLQRAAIEQEQAAEETRLIVQSGIIGDQQLRLGAGAALPDYTGLILGPPAELDKAVEDDAAARAAFGLLADAWGKPDDEFAAAVKQADTAIEMRETSVMALNSAVAAEIARRQETVAELKLVDEKLKSGLAPEAAKILETGTPKSVSNFNEARKKLDLEMAALEQAATDAAAEAFDLQADSVRNAFKAVESRIAGINSLAKAAREKDRADRIKGLMPRAEADTAAGILETQDLQKTLAGKIQTHKKLYAELTQMPKTATTELFDGKAAEVEVVRDEADTAALALQQAVSDEKQRRRDMMALVDTARRAFPDSRTVSGTPEAAEALEAAKPFRLAFQNAEKLVGAGKAAGFSAAEQKARALLPPLKNAIEAANLKADERAQKLKGLRDELDTLVTQTVAALAAAPPLQAVMDRVRETFQRTATDIIRLITGLNDKNDQAEAEKLRKYARQAGRLGTTLLQLDPGRWTLAVDNVCVAACINELQKCLASPGIGDTCILRMEELCKTVTSVAGQYSGVAGLQRHVTTAMSTPNTLPQQQAILVGYTAFAAKANLDTLNVKEIPAKVKKFQDACSAVAKVLEDADDRAAYLASPMAAFIAYFNDTSHSNNQICAELLRLLNSDGDDKAVLQPVPDGYQCKDEKDGNFSVEGEIRIGGRPGLLVHAHCRPNGVPKNGNSCHIKLLTQRHLTGGYSVMLNPALRGRLLFSSAENLDAVKSLSLE